MKKNNNTPPNIRQFITSVVKHRQMLIKKELNCKNVARMNLLIDEVYTNWLQVYPKANFIQLANFFVKHQNEIFELMPGEKSTHYKKFVAGFDTHVAFAQNLLNDHPAYFKVKTAYNNFKTIMQKELGHKVQTQVMIHNVPKELFGDMSVLTEDVSVQKLSSNLGTHNELFLLRKK